MCSQKIKIGIMGAGAFGTSLAILYSKFHSVTLFSAFAEHVSSMRQTGENEFLKGFKLPKNLDIKTISELGNCDFNYIFWCFPITPSLEILNTLLPNIKTGLPIIICAKGITSDGTFLMDEFTKILPGNPIGVLSGPNFAIEIAAFLHSAADIGFKNLEIATKISKDLSNKHMRLVPTDDVIGVQVAGAMKNVIAIACGILVGLQAGKNAVSALLTYGLKEISAAGVALGARVETFYGLSGIGDLVLTSSGDTSRNMSFGKSIGEGEDVESILKNSVAVSEGAICVKYISKMNVKAPICETVLEIINGIKTPDAILEILNA